MSINPCQISRRSAVLSSFALPLAAGSSFAAAPMGDAELHALLRVCSEARKSITAQTDKSAIDQLITQRNAEIGRIIRPSGGPFANWSAIAREVSPTEVTGLRCLLALDQETSLVTAFSYRDKLAKVALASVNKSVRISGAISSRRGLPLDMLADKPTEGISVELLALITAIDQ